MDDSGVCCCFPSCDISQLLLIPFIDSTVLRCVFTHVICGVVRILEGCVFTHGICGVVRILEGYKILMFLRCVFTHGVCEIVRILEGCKILMFLRYVLTPV